MFKSILFITISSLLFSFTRAIPSVECLKYFNHLQKAISNINDPSHIQLTEKLLIALSGKSINDLGLYNECNRYPS